MHIFFIFGFEENGIKWHQMESNNIYDVNDVNDVNDVKKRLVHEYFFHEGYNAEFERIRWIFRS